MIERVSFFNSLRRISFCKKEGPAMVEIMFLIILILIFVFLISILRIRFFTLVERKILAHLQLRKGPNKVSIRGVFQPFRDAIKLFRKERFIPCNANKWIFCAARISML